jgi:hypothetical protein
MKTISEVKIKHYNCGAHLGRILPSTSSSYVFKKSAALRDPDICKLTAAVPTALKLIGSPVAVGTM